MNGTMLAALVLWGCAFWGIGGDAARRQTGATGSRQTSATHSPKAEDPVSVAERISRLQSSVQAAKKQLAAFQAQFDDPASEYNDALQEFQSLDEELHEVNQKAQLLLQQGKKADAEDQQIQALSLQERRQLASERLALA